MGSTTLNALIGAVVNVLVTPILPFAPVVGGAVAGYLEAGERRSNNGVRAGAIAGLVAYLVLTLLALVLGGLLFAVVASVAPVPAAFGGIGIAVLLLAAIVGLVYTVGLSALGGFLGVYVHDNLDL